MTEHLIEAVVQQMNALTANVIQIFLKPRHYVNYQAGQYLQIHMDNDALSYSIANAPGEHEEYELHIKRILDHPSNRRLFDLLTTHKIVNISLPFGRCCMNHLEPNKPILFIAGGTGFAPVKSMIEQLMVVSDPRPMELIWGARSGKAIYMDDLVKEWVKTAQSLTYHPIADRGKNSLASFMLAHHQHDLHDWQIVISGAFDMVYSIRDELVSHGVSTKQLHSDAFAFE